MLQYTIDHPDLAPEIWETRVQARRKSAEDKVIIQQPTTVAVEAAGKSMPANINQAASARLENRSARYFQEKTADAASISMRQAHKAQRESLLLARAASWQLPGSHAATSHQKSSCMTTAKSRSNKNQIHEDRLMARVTDTLKTAVPKALLVTDVLGSVGERCWVHYHERLGMAVDYVVVLCSHCITTTNSSSQLEEYDCTLQKTDKRQHGWHSKPNTSLRMNEANRCLNKGNVVLDNNDPQMYKYSQTYKKLHA